MTVLDPVTYPDDLRQHYGDSRASFTLARETARVQIVARFTVEGEPVSKARARFTGYKSKSRAYTPEKTRVAEERMAWQFKLAAPTHRPDNQYTYGIMAVFFHGTRQRRDVDNMLKLICDALNGVAWADDVQVEEVSARRGYDLAHPRTEVLIYRVSRVEVGSTLVCVECGTEFKTYKSWSRRQYCSRACIVAAGAKRRAAGCLHCGTEFQSRHAARYCSKDCAYKAKHANLTCAQCGKEYSLAQSVAPRVALCSDVCRDAYWKTNRRTAPAGWCADCGGPKSKPSYVRCAACAVIARRKS